MRVRVKSVVSSFLLCACLAAFGEIAVTFYGGAGQVGGSCALVESGGFRMLVDCGTAYGSEHTATNALAHGGFGFDPASIDCIP